MILLILPIVCAYVAAFFLYLMLDREKRGFIHICKWVTVFLGLVLIFLPWNIFITSGGVMNSIKSFNIFVSSIYLIGWFLLSLWAGFKNRYEVLIASLAYSSVPIIGHFLLKANILYAMGFWFYWSVPIQGLSFREIEFINALMVIQPLLFIGGYRMSKHLAGNKTI